MREVVLTGTGSATQSFGGADGCVEMEFSRVRRGASIRIPSMATAVEAAEQKP